jgi:hypothetical protein
MAFSLDVLLLNPYCSFAKILLSIVRLLYMFFWVFPRRQIVFCRRFGTLCQVHLQRLDVEYEVWMVTNQPTKDLTEGGELREAQVDLPSVCIAIPALVA